MSSDDIYTGTRFGGPQRTRTNSLAPTSRADIGQLLGAQETEPTLWQAVNYPTDDELENFETHWLRYQRQGVAAGLVDKKVNETWQEAPEAVDESTEEDEGESSEFDDEVERFMSGDTLRREPLHRFKVADTLATLGEYAVIVLGFADGRDLSTPVRGLDEDEEGEFNGLDDLNYIATFGQDRVIEPFDVVTDMKSERFRLPEEYDVVVERGDEGEDADEVIETVHWSRVIHVTEGTLEDDLRGEQYLKNIFHNLVNLDKILAGSAEGYWRGGYAGMILRPPTGPNGQQLRFDDGDGSDSSELQEEIEQYERNMKRTIATTGEVQTLAPNVGDPSPHAAEQYKEIAAAKQVPQSMLMGNETGERATSEDSSMWDEHIAGLRNNYAGPSIYRPTIDRLIDTGVLPQPSGDGYGVEWSALDELSAKDEAEISQILADAVNTLTGGQPDRLATRGELRELLDWDPEVGAESDVADEDQPDADEFETDTDESDPEVQAAFENQQADGETDAADEDDQETPSDENDDENENE